MIASRSSRLALTSFTGIIAKSICCLTAILGLAAGQANAGFLLDFNALDDHEYSQYGNQTYGSSADPIEEYIESVIGSDVWVYRGTKTLKYKPENVGPWAYLGNTDYGVWHPNPKDTYLINRWQDGYDRITMIFEVALTSISFDWQIFPATQGKSDIKVLGDGVEYFHYDNSANVLNGAMGHASIVFNAPVHKLEFVDWKTAPVGIDNLYISSEVPEPATGVMALLGTLGITVIRRRKTAAASA